MITIDKDLLDENLELSQLVLNSLGVYVSIKDKNKKYIYANRKLEALFESDFESIIGCEDSQLYGFSGYSDIINNDARVLYFGDTVEKKEVVTIKSTGQDKAFLSAKQPIFSNEKEIIGVLCVSTEITDIHVKQKELEAEAYTDPLTGLFNRRFFFELANKLFSESSRHKNSLSAIMLDIDFFKEINDKHGHPVGDKVIQFVASKTKSMLRKEDTIARIGGEEYIILLPNTDGQAAEYIAEKIRVFIDSESMADVASEIIYPKISLGISTYKESDFHFNEIYVRCDKALYQAKMTGRNKICLYEAV